MSDQARMYIAGMGMITPIGADTTMTAAAVKAQVSGYQASGRFTQPGGQPITMTRVPRSIFEPLLAEIDQGRCQSAQYDRIIIMAILALREALAGQSIKKPVPLILAMPEERPNVSYVPTELLITNLVNQKDLPLHADLVRSFHAGRAGGIQGLELAQHYLSHQKADYVLLGGSDSYWDTLRLGELEKENRLLAPYSADGFAPGEGAGFLLLTRHPEKAMAKGGHVIALSRPGSSQEPGHLHSDEPYRGDGLDKAFKQALGDHAARGIKTIYSSMNGEHHWAKEYGVAFIRNSDHFHDPVNIEHPADCYGDLGSATAPVLIALAADDLLKRPGLATHLVYSSSDGAARAAVRVEKISRAVNQ